MNLDIKTVDEYVKGYPKEVSLELKAIRALVKKEAPKALEGISYGMPAYKLNGKPLVYFSGYGKHIGFYPTPSGIMSFKEELAKYRTSKGAVQLPIDKPIPTALLRRIIKFRVKEVLGK